jgi:HK97 family phage major capsid protein
MNYERILSAVMSHPWAITTEKYNAVVSVLARREAGERFTDEQISAAVGTPRTVATPPYLVGDDGRVYRERVERDEEGAVVSRTSAYEAAAAAKSSTKMVAVLPVFGVILPRAADFDMSETGTGIDQLRAQFRQALSHPDVSAIVLHFDSPGGSVYHVDEFAKEIFDAREQKKIVSQIDPFCASAAYYLATQAKEIVITPSGEVGSIGVRSMHVDMSEALKQKGFNVTHIAAGKYKVEGNPHEPLSEEGLAFQQQRVNEYYDSFVDAVARGREVKASEVRGGFGEGRVVGSAEAKKLGMVDRLATFDETLARLGVSAEKGRVAVTSAAASSGGSTTASAENKQEVLAMSTAANAAAGAANDGMILAETERCSRIMQLAQTHGQFAKAAAWIKDNKSVSQVQAEILSTLSANPVPAAAAEERRGASAAVVVDEEDKLEKGAIFGRICRAYAATKGNVGQAAIFASRVLHSPKTASMFEAAVDPQRAGDFASGGFLLRSNVSSEVIELLRPKSVVRSANPTLAPLVDGSLDLPKLTGGATASYVGETKQIAATKVTGGSIRAAAKTLATIVVISNKLLRSPSANADTIVRNDAIRAIAQAEDLAFLRSAGTVYSPKGLLFWKGTGSFSANGTVNLVNVTADLQKAITAVEEANADMTNLCWFIAPRTKGYLMQVRDGNGNYAFKDEMVRGTLMGIPFRSTSQIPRNLGGGASSEIYLAGMSDVVITDAPQIAIEYTSEASIDDGAGNVTPLFQTDMSAIKVIEEHDLVVRHQESIVVIDTVNWV